MVVCVHTPLPEVVELMRPSSTEVNTGNMNLTPPGQTSLNSLAEVIPGLQVAFDSPWLIRWCTHCANRRDNSLVVRLEAMQFLASFLKSYVFLARYVCAGVTSCDPALALPLSLGFLSGFVKANRNLGTSVGKPLIC